MLELKNVHKSFGDVQVLNKVDLTLEKRMFAFPFHHIARRAKKRTYRH